MTILFRNLQITRSDFRPHVNLAVSLVTANGHFNLRQGFEWVCLSYNTHFITQEGHIRTRSSCVVCGSHPFEPADIFILHFPSIIPFHFLQQQETYINLSLQLAVIHTCKKVSKIGQFASALQRDILALTLPGPSAGLSGSLDSYCMLKPLCSGMGEVVPARTSPTLLPHPLALCCHYPVSKCCSASIVMTSTVRVN